MPVFFYEPIVIIFLIAFACEYIDSTLGMGYGTTLTPILLIMGYSPLEVIPVILISELITGLLASILHHHEGNVDLKPKTWRLRTIYREIKENGIVESISRGMPRHLKVAMVLSICSFFGTVIAVFVAINLPKLWLKLYIGLTALVMGIVILLCYQRDFSFSWKKIIGLGALASFNKGISGGGYGPVVTSGQILAGVEGKSAVGVTSFAESFTCAVGILTYFIAAKSPLNFALAPYVTAGAILSVPLSAKSVKFFSENSLKLSIGFFTTILGLCTIYKAFA